MNIQQEKIYNYLLDNISGGMFGENKRIPTENELCQLFGTNRMNAHFAIKELERSGVLRRNKKQGTFVNSIPSLYSLGELKSAATRRVCILNQCSPALHHIHLNSRTLSPLETLLRSKGIDVDCKDICGIRKVDKYKSVLAGLIDSGCNALILVADGTGEGIAFEHPELLSDFHNNVFIFDPGQAIWQSMPYNVVTVNIFGEGVMAADYLLSKGYRDICFCQRSSLERIWLRERFRGIECAFRRSGLKITPSSVELDPEKSNSAFFKNLKKSDGNGTAALIAMNDSFAVDIIKQASEYGIKFGQGIGLISFDDNTEFRSYDLTTIAPSFDKIGERLAKMIIDNINKEESADQILCMKIDSKLITRRTS
jgi:DNA-binding LacI/PurR family transcriptional regulator/DNA-binding transcriptional regulator YhcF (GntR family)